jgi:hypothetical protein
MIFEFAGNMATETTHKTSFGRMIAVNQSQAQLISLIKKRQLG